MTEEKEINNNSQKLDINLIEKPKDINSEPEGLEEFHENHTVILSRKIRIFVFCLFLILSVVADLDNGLFSASIKAFQKDLGLENDLAKYGLFVSISFIGRIVGLVIFMAVINFKHRKFTLILTIFLHGSSYILYSLSKNYSLLIFAKMFAAANKVCASVYRPVWIEQFGLSNYKSIFFSLVQIMSSYGQTIGFNLGTLFFKEKWELGLIYILILMYIIAICFTFVPGKYFKRSYMFYENKLVDTIDDENENKEGSQNSRSSTSTNIENENIENNENIKNSFKRKKKTIFINLKKIKKKKGKKYNFCSLLKDLLLLIKNQIYLFCAIKRAINTFIFQIIHSYLKVYQESVFTNYKEKLLLLFYSLSTLLSTAIGGLLGGIITQKLGGYNDKKSIFVVIIPELITTINLTFLVFTFNFYIYNVNLLLFFGFVSMGAPVLQGYLITTIPKPIKGIGIGLDMILSTFLGKIPGPIIYGALNDKYSKTKPYLAWRICLSTFYFGFVMVILICIFKYFEKPHKGTSEVSMENQINEIAAISSGADSNDLFKLKMPTPRRYKSVHERRSNFEIPLFNVSNENNDENISSIN